MPRPKGKKIPGKYFLNTKTKNKLEWIQKDSPYSDCFIGEASVIEQSIALMYLLMTDKKYDRLIQSFFERPVE